MNLDFMRPKFVALCAALACGPMLYAQSNQVLAASAAAAPQGAAATTVSGEVTDPSGEPLIGVTVGIEGKGAVASTDIDGRFSVKARTGDVLTFTYIGFSPTTVKVTGVGPISVTMTEDSKTLDEVVVTALGIKREQKSLSYNVQQVKGDALTTNKDANFINNLAGKVAGVNINASSSGTGGISKVVMRGSKSIYKSDQALYVIDGVPMRPAVNFGSVGPYASSGATDPIADINPEDIESMSVLTGAAAAALYGSDAANGAIVITTKKGQAVKTTINVSTNLEFNNAFVTPRFQNRYGAGQFGAYDPGSNYSWGAPMSAYNNYGYDFASDYLNTGTVATNTVSFSTGTEKNQTYASAASVNSQGIIPNNKYNRYNFSVRNTSKFLDDKMTLDLSASYIYQNDQNMVNQGTYSNPLLGAYLVPRNVDWNSVKMYEVFSNTRMLNVQNWAYGDYGMSVQNPYWVNYRNMNENSKDRFMFSAQLSYKVLPYLTLMGRVRMDNSYVHGSEKLYATTNTQLTANSSNGYYEVTTDKNKQVYADFLVSFNKDLGEDFNLQANFGGSIDDNQYSFVSTGGGIADGNGAFPGVTVAGLANKFSLKNVAFNKVLVDQVRTHNQVQSLYGSIDLGYKNTYYLTVTGRNDWPSALAGPKSEKTSYFYPSVGVSILLHQMMADAGVDINPDYFSFWKIRASWASVGTSFPSGLSNPGYGYDDVTHSYKTKTRYPLYSLLPERTKSWEVGMNFRFLKDFSFDATWYKSNTYDQTIQTGVAAGPYDEILVQTGNVENWGMEFALNYDHRWGDFSWTTGLTYSFNKNKIISLAEKALNPVSGEPLGIKQLSVGEHVVGTQFILRSGGSMGDLYSTQSLLRDANGNIYIDENGSAHQAAITDADEYIKLGSVLPKGNLAWSNTFTWKNLSASFMISARLGGIVFSRTQSLLDQYGVSEATGNARDLGYVSLNNGDRVDPELWYSTITAGETVPQYYTYSATNVRLQSASIGYLIPRKWLGGVCDIKVSLIGRNLWMIYNKAPFDPEAVASAGNFYQGIDNFMMPSLRSFGFNVNFNF